MLQTFTILVAGPNLNDHIVKYYDYIENSFTIVNISLI